VESGRSLTFKYLETMEQKYEVVVRAT